MPRLGALQQWQSQENAPEAPAGLSQAARSGREYEQSIGQVPGGAGRFSVLGQYVSERGYTGAAQSWYTGANQEGTNNGWSTEFWDKAFDQIERFGEQGKLGVQFEQPNATGVVTWDHDSEDGTQHFKFGDVYQDGKKVANVYKTFDKDTANLMMSDLLWDNDKKADIFSDSDPRGRLDREIRDQRTENKEIMPTFLRQEKLAGDVEETSEEFEEGQVDEAIVGGAALTGGLAAGGAGFALGSVVPGIGNAIGFGAGFVGGSLVGGVGAYMNKDALTEQAARAYEITAMSDRENGTAAAWATGVNQWAGFGGKALNPLSNTVQGLYDFNRGDIGDGESEYYNDEAKGQLPKWVKVADVTASIADAAITFASPLGMAMYTTQMTGVIGGEVAELGLTGGKSFSYEKAGFDNIFTDDDGNFDGTSALAGIGKVGIDVVQLGMARGLAGKVDAATLALGRQATYAGAGGLRGALTSGAGLSKWLPGVTLGRGAGRAGADVEAGAGTRIGGITAEQKEALKAGTAFETERAGMKYIVDKGTGKAIGPKRWSVSLLAPSEQLSAISTRVEAMRIAAKRNGALTSDDFYRAAEVLANGERKIQTSLVTGFGEASEEVIQVVLEQHSHGYSATGSEIVNAGLYGFAGGLGMGVGTGTRMPSADSRMAGQARSALQIRTGGLQMSDAQWAAHWKSLSPTEKRKAASMTKMERETLKAAYSKMNREQATEINAGVVGANKLADAINSELDRRMQNSMPATDGSIVATQIEDAGEVDADGNVKKGFMPADAIGASGFQTATNIRNHLRGVEIQLDYLSSEQERLDAQLTAEPANEEFQAAAAAGKEQIAATVRTLEAGKELYTVIEDSVSRMYAPTANAITIAAEVDDLNMLLRDAFNMRMATVGGRVLEDADRLAMARAISMVFTRYPQDQAGSYQMLVPQVSTKLTLEKDFGDNVVEVSHGILAAIRGDYDGDRVVPLNQLVLDSDQFTAARSGAYFLGAGTSVNVATPVYEEYIVDQMARSLDSNNVSLAAFATGTLTDIGDMIRNRYDGVVDPLVLDNVLNEFNRAVHSNDGDSRKKLLDGLAQEAGREITEFARGRLSNEWLWIDQVVRSTLQRFQENYAAHRPSAAPVPNTERVVGHKQSREVEQRIIDDASVTGMSLALITEGDSMFRKFQKLHFSSRTAAVTSAEYAQEDRMSLVEQAALYEALGSGITQSALDEIAAKDDITARVMAWLQVLANDARTELNGRLNPMEAMLVVANLRVRELDVDIDGQVLPDTSRGRGAQVTLLQMLLKKSIAIDRRKQDSIFDASKELQAKHARLTAMTRPYNSEHPVNAHRAFCEVFGSQQMFSLLGDDAFIFGPHLTLEQFLRKYVSMHEEDRQNTDEELRAEAAFLGRNRAKNLPYDLDEMFDEKNNVQISAFRSVVDSVIAVGHNRITMDKAGNPDGEYADQSKTIGAAFRDGVEQARQAVYNFLNMQPADAELSVELVQRLMEQNPNAARLVMDLIPEAATMAAMRVLGDQVVMSNWVYEMLAAKTPKHAEMIYWRNLTLAQWNAKGMASVVNEEEAEAGLKGRNFHNLDRRIHRVMWMLAANKDHRMMEQFITRMENETDPDMFIAWVNATPGLRGDQAPLTLWVDDVGTFDQDKAGGGWTNNTGSSLKEAILNFQIGTTNLAKDLAEEKLAIKADEMTLSGLERAIAYHRGDPDAKMTEADEQLYKNMQATINEAAELGVSLGPAAMIYQTIGAARGFYPQAHTKGAPPEYVEIQGQHDALRDAYDFTANYERVLSSLTALNMDAVHGGLSEVARDSGRTMDDEGRQVQWGKPSVEEMVKLLRQPGTRPLARAILFPQAMERSFDGRMQTQLLVDKDLNSLLSGKAHNDLFARNGRIENDEALRYCVLVETTARRYGGHFSLQRAVNDIVIARTSAADHVLSVKELESITIETYREVALILQGTGAIKARVVAPDEDPLGDLLKASRATQQVISLGRRLNLSAVEGLTVDKAVEVLLSEAKLEAQEEKKQLRKKAKAAKDPAQKVRFADAVLNVDAQNNRFAERVALMMSGDVAGQISSRFEYHENMDEAEKLGRQRVIAQYVYDNMRTIEEASSELVTVMKLTSQLQDPARQGRVDLKDSEWEALGNSIIGIQVAQTLLSPGQGVAIGAFPGRIDDRKYWDDSFSYLLTPLMDPTGELVRAAHHIHLNASRFGEGESIRTPDMIELLGRTLFKEGRFGRWTPEIPRASMEANNRLDSASSAATTAMAGNSPKRQAVITAATRRTWRLPTDEELPNLLATTSLTMFDLGKDLFDSVDVNFPGDPLPKKRPLAELNNRFASSVTLRYRDAAGVEQPLNLLATDRHLGRPFPTPDPLLNSGYEAIHLSRMKVAVQRAVTNLGLTEADVIGVDVEYFHPELQPTDTDEDKATGRTWYNNILFEGTSFLLDADRHESLIATLWFANDSINPAVQGAGLDSQKLGMPAFQHVSTPTARERTDMEQNWTTDFARMLREKAETILGSNMGTGKRLPTGEIEAGKLDPEFYNAIYKDLRMRHYVRGTDPSGNVVLWTSEQVVEWQRTHIDPATNLPEALPLTDADLWIPSDDVLRSMLGEFGDQGVARVFADQLEVDLSRVPRYKGVTPEMVSRFESGVKGETVGLSDTRVANLARQSVLATRPYLTEQQREVYDGRQRYFAEQRQEIQDDRARYTGQTGPGGFNPSTNLTNTLRDADKMLEAENISFDWAAGGILFFGPRKANDIRLSQMVARDLNALLSADGGFRTGWVYREGVDDQPPSGLISNISLQEGKLKGAFRVSPGDLVLLDLDSFNGDIPLMKKRAGWLAGRGATIVLSGGSGTWGRPETAQYLAEVGYGRVAGSGHVYRPNDVTSRYQNMRARTSTMMETRGVSRRGQVATFWVPDLPIQENAGWVNPDDPRHTTVAVTLDLVPTSILAGFNVPTGSFTNESQIGKVKQHLSEMNTDEGMALLCNQANGHLKGEKRENADAEIKYYFDRLIRRFVNNGGTVLPVRGDDFGTGDMIPLVDGQGRVLIYRHGYKAPRRDGDEGIDMMMQDEITKGVAHNVAIYPTKPDPNSTTHTGTVRSFNPRSGYGLSVDMDIDLAVFGDKKVLEWNGMKILLTPMPDSIVLPDHGFFPKWALNIIANMKDMVSKESFDGLINNHRNAFAYFGIDFTNDIAKAFNTTPEKAVDLLHSIARTTNTMPVEAADTLINGPRLNRNFQGILDQAALEHADKVDVGWVEQIADPTTVEQQIAAAMVVYLTAPGARVEHVLSSGGFNDESSTIDAQSRLMPRLFTQFFDNAELGSELRMNINKRLNDQLHNPHQDGTGYTMGQDFTFEVRNGVASREIPPLSIADAEARFTARGMTVDREEETHTINGVDRHLVKYWVRSPTARYGVGHFWFDKNDGEIIAVDVDPAFQRQGIATDMMKYAEAAAAVEGWTRPAHSGVISAAGASWAEAVSARTPEIGTPQKNMVGYLMFSEAHSAGTNPVLNGQAFDERGKQGVSYHTAATAYQAIGARTPYSPEIERAREFARGEGIHRFERDDVDGGAWRMLNDIDISSAEPWRRATPAESARRTLARDAVVQFRQKLNREDKNGWDSDKRAEYDQAASAIVTRLGLQSEQAEVVDYWVRQMLGMPEGKDKDGADVGWVNHRGAMQVLSEILWNVERGYMPVVSAMVPLMHAQDLQMIYRANQNRPEAERWAPREGTNSNSNPATSWQEWCETSLGSALLSDNMFDPLYLLALDGHMHSYQNATRSMLDLPVSLDALKSQQLLDPDTNRLLISLDGNTDLLEKDPILLEMTKATLDEIIGGRRLASGFEAKAAPAAEVARRRENIRKWRKETGMPAPVDVTLRNFRKNGAEFVDKASSANAFYRILVNIRVGTALINPALYVSMGPEQWVRGSLDRLANIISGQGTVGATTRLHAKMSDKAATRAEKREEARVEKLDKRLAQATSDEERAQIETELGKAPRSTWMEALGIEHRYTRDQIVGLNDLYKILGRRTDFNSMLYSDLWHLRPHEEGVSKVEKFFGGYAKFGSRMQDPTRGMRNTTMARRYLEAVMQHIEATPTMDVITTDQLIAVLRTNPTWLRDHHPEAHKAGANAVAQIRSLKQTIPAKILKGFFEPLAASDNLLVNSIGNLVFKIPLLFSGYAMNVIVTITGMQGVNDMLAMFLHGRKKGAIVRTIQKKLNGQELSEEDLHYDMSDIMEGIDLTRSFIRGGLTHTGLMAFGLMAGGLGLSGEDDETKKRRKMAEAQGAAFVYDPRRIVNDFRNADALFIDWLPFNFQNYFKVSDPSAPGGQENMVQMHWMLKQFFSPMIGMEKFFETGDYRQVLWGFEDAVGSFPIINQSLYSDAVTTAAELANEADKSAELGGPENNPKAVGLLINSVGVMERMLFENSFINAIYVGHDKYDRDPYSMPLRDSDGTIQRDIENQARAQNLSVEKYIDENRDKLKREIAGGEWEGELYVDPDNGEIKVGYQQRDMTDAVLHGLTENRGTMALAMGLFSGLTGVGNTDWSRYNMVPKIREFEKPKMTQDEAEAAILAAFHAPKSRMPNLSVEELASLIKKDLTDRGIWWEEAEVMQIATQKAKEQRPAALSVMIDDREYLTQAGAVGIFKGLSKGTVDFSSAALDGVHVNFEMREKIQKEWMAEIIKEGRDLGLDPSKALSRMKRLWYGPIDEPDVVGLGDILWSKDISYTDTLKFNQLNTTYVEGPDGLPWATGFTRDGVFGALGIKPVNRAYVSKYNTGMTGTDQRLNTTYIGGNLGGMNTGLRALELIDESRYVPTDVEIGKSIEDAIKEAAKDDVAPFTPYSKQSGSGYTPFRRYGGYGGGGGGGGYFSAGYADFSKMYTLPHGRAPYGSDIPFINTTNPLIRRADIRRERVWSERGRLKQWQ